MHYAQHAADQFVPRKAVPDKPVNIVQSPFRAGPKTTGLLTKRQCDEAA